jgi:uncharacterized protein (TIGR03435 family)
MNRCFAPSRKLSRAQVELAGTRVLRRLQAEPMWQSDAPLFDPGAVRHDRRFPRIVALPAAAALVLALVAGALVMRYWSAVGDGSAVVETVDGGLYRVTDTKTAGLNVNDRIGFGDTVRSNGGLGGILALADGSRVEMRSQSELSLERADDGVRIRLARGGIIVNAATQRSGHLYVQTRDVTVSVVGTVFLVNADEEGSRVAVIEGEVRVQQGDIERNLRPGEQVITNPGMERLPVAEGLAWSRQAEARVALLQQAMSSAASQTSAVQVPTADRVAFEEISIRPSGPAAPPAPGARGGGGGRNSRPAESGCVFDSMGYSYQLDPRRFAVTRVTLLHLAAYTIPNPKFLPGQEQRRSDVNCGVLTNTGLLSGGPDWIRTDMWDVVASIPEGVLTGSPRLTDPVVQQMLRTMLAERFNVVIRRETREVPVYLLKVGKDGPKFNGQSPMAANRDPDRGPVMMLLGPDGKPTPAADLPPPPEGAINIIGFYLFGARNISMTQWADHLFGLDGRPVLDRTGLTGRHDFHYEDPAGRPRSLDVLPAAGSLDRAVVKAMGFELEESRAPYDVWAIERAERPTEN